MKHDLKKNEFRKLLKQSKKRKKKTEKKKIWNLIWKLYNTYDNGEFRQLSQGEKDSDLEEHVRLWAEDEDDEALLMPCWQGVKKWDTTKSLKLFAWKLFVWEILPTNKYII